MQIFVTGTDTDVGKTFVSLWLAHQLKWPYFKPIQTGPLCQSDSTFIRAHSSTICLPEHYRFLEPCSPHLAAKYESQAINWDRLQAPHNTPLIMEGAGGLFVPITEPYSMIDLIAKWRVPVILVARTTLGTFNHTLMSIAALHAREIPILSICFNGPKTDGLAETVERYCINPPPVFFAPYNASCSIAQLIEEPVPSKLLDILMRKNEYSS